MLRFLFLLFFPAVLLAQETVEVTLFPQIPNKERTLGWSPYGQKLPLIAITEDVMSTSLSLGNTTFNLQLSKENNPHFNRLWIDFNRDGKFMKNEFVETTPDTSRGKIWSSFTATINLPIHDDNQENFNAYPLSFWYVFDPQAEEQEEVLRFSRRGWHEGTAILDGEMAYVLITESEMDGVFDEYDYWALAFADSVEMLTGYKNSKGLNRHNWLGEKAYKVTEIHPSGRKISIASFNPSITHAEEIIMEDHLREDKQAERTETSVTFLHDFGEAEALAKQEGKQLFIDFETTWCGPCKEMDEWVYTATAIVQATQNLISVKVDGDEHPDLVERFGVFGYPTLILLDETGNEKSRASGYQSIKNMLTFFNPE